MSAIFEKATDCRSAVAEGICSFVFKGLPATLALCLGWQLPLLGSAQAELCSAIRSLHANDFDYSLDHRRVSADTSAQAAPTDYARRDSLLIQVDSGYVSIETENWSLGVSKSVHLGIFKRATTSQGYFFSPRDPLSILFFALEHAVDTMEQAQGDTSLLSVRVQENGVWLTRVDVHCNVTGRLNSLTAWYESRYGVGFRDEIILKPGAQNPVLIESYLNAVGFVAGQIQLSGLFEGFPVIDTDHPVLPSRKP